MLTENTLVRVTKYSNKIRELPVIKRISVNYPLLCKNIVASMLAEAANKLPDNLFLQVDSAYRTRKTQHILWESRKDIMPGLVYNPENGVPPHCTGGALDVSLVDKNGIEINLSEPFSKYYDEPQLNSQKISPKARDLRVLLNKIMLDVGFAPNQKEYWHFSYGDKMWADYFNQKVKYEEIELPTKYYHSLFQRLYFKTARRLWKLKNKFFSVKTNY